MNPPMSQDAVRFHRDSYARRVLTCDRFSAVRRSIPARVVRIDDAYKILAPDQSLAWTRGKSLCH